MDDVTRVLAVRHGETAWNVDTRLQGQIDISLNSTGQEQARRLAEALAEEGVEAIVASDLVRARDTAQAVADRTGLPLVTDAGLRERHFGIFQGHTYAEVEQRWPDESARWRKRDPGFGAPGGAWNIQET